MFLLHLIITLCNSRMLIEIHCMCQPGVMQIFAFLLFIKHLVAQEWNVLSAWLLQVKCSQKNKTTDLKYNITQSSHAKQPCKKYWFHKTSQCCLPPPNYPKLSNTVSQSTMQNVSLKINTFDSVWKNEQRGEKKPTELNSFVISFSAWSGHWGCAPVLSLLLWLCWKAHGFSRNCPKAADTYGGGNTANIKKELN